MPTTTSTYEPLVLVDTADLPEDEWLEYRRRGIGGSDAAAILGVLPNGKTAILEIKTTNYNAKDHWWCDGQEIVPINYEIQGRHYMCVMNVDEVYYCCLYGNNENEVIIRHIERDLDYEAELIALEGDFWNSHILAQVPPPYTEDGDLIIESARRHFGPADENAPEIVLSVPLASSLVRYTELQAEKSELNREVKRVENEMKRLQGRIVAEMGRSCVATANSSDGSYTITYKPVIKPGIDKESLIRLRAQHPDIYEEYVSLSESRRFYVKRSLDEAA